MEASKALEIIQALADGVDPHTGEEFEAESPYQHSQTVRALFVAIQALERVKRTGERQRKLPDNAGKSWTDNEDQRLVAGFDAGRTTKELAEEHRRTEGSIRSRLVKHGKIQF